MPQVTDQHKLTRCGRQAFVRSRCLIDVVGVYAKEFELDLFLLEIEPEQGWSNDLRDLASQSWVIDADGNFEELGAVFTAC
ncbi:hypothetical protein [Acaryochloris sp. CCMEE 5410]|uniref:hypothetical protein n=1 Tax=Acaryochloris sp. CCMEE 5410 TaxID=310037 RepID=UPI00111297E5|nr:hypothetical protein [Acaryochloris sp. CCMEE 5410]KAI9129896.1 hypothetical protein ON05_032295 [Acaryochloris sp. CCMEE 5410]